MQELGKRVIYEVMCTRCKYKWFPTQWDDKENKQMNPKTCPNPNCKSIYWDKEPIRPHSEETKKKLKKAWKYRKLQ